jgi:hypothetical protein
LLCNAVLAAAVVVVLAALVQDFAALAVFLVDSPAFPLADEPALAALVQDASVLALFPVEALAFPRSLHPF